MARIQWGKVGERYFESGVDRGVLYVGGVGVPWNGLKSVKESTSGGGPKAFYQDGIKYLNLAESEEFQATIEAFSAPAEFGVCEGDKALYAGLIATQQPRKPFGFSYRTGVGNDISGLELGYKIHLVYNALAGPSSRDRTSLGGSTDPISLSWAVTTTPPITPGIRPTAHLVIDSRTTQAGLLRHIEDILYGTALLAPRLPTTAELIAWFSSSGPDSYKRINESMNPNFVGSFGWASPLSLYSDGHIIVNTALNEFDALLFETVDGDHTANAGDIWSASVDVQLGSLSDEVSLCLALFTYRSDGGYEIYYGPITTVTNVTTSLTVTSPALPPLTNQVVVTLVARAPIASGKDIFLYRGLTEKAAVLGPYFDGNSPDVDGNYYDWEGTVNQSRSRLKTWN